MVEHYEIEKVLKTKNDAKLCKGYRIGKNSTIKYECYMIVADETTVLVGDEDEMSKYFEEL